MFAYGHMLASALMAQAARCAPLPRVLLGDGGGEKKNSNQDLGLSQQVSERGDALQALGAPSK